MEESSFKSGSALISKKLPVRALHGSAIPSQNFENLARRCPPRYRRLNAHTATSGYITHFSRFSVGISGPDPARATRGSGLSADPCADSVTAPEAVAHSRTKAAAELDADSRTTRIADAETIINAQADSLSNSSTAAAPP